MKQNKKEQGCDHEIGYKAMGGFPGHEHIHSTGEQFCFNCEKTLKEIIQKAHQDGYAKGRIKCLEQYYEDRHLLTKF